MATIPLLGAAEEAWMRITASSLTAALWRFLLNLKSSGGAAAAEADR
jgi:hypothetical protein